MRVNNKIRILFGVVLFSFIFLFFPNFSNAKSEISFGQSILPVKFVYLDMSRKTEIRNIWSNVTERDSLYKIKFIDLKNKKEVGLDEKLLNAYQEIAKKESSFLSGSLTVDFFQNGETLEEVRTYV